MSTKITNLQAAVASFGFTTEDMTLTGVVNEARRLGNGWARLALPVWFLTTKDGGSVKRQTIMDAIEGLSAPRLTSMIPAGEILSRIGEGADAYAAQALAVCHALNKKDRALLLVGDNDEALTGQALAAKITECHNLLVQGREEAKAAKAAQEAYAATEEGRAAAAKAKADRQEAEAKAEREAARPAKKIGQALDALQAVQTLTARERKGLAAIIGAVLVEAVRVANVAGVDVDSVLADYAAQEAVAS